MRLLVASAILMCLAGCVRSQNASEFTDNAALARDIVSRRERDFYYYSSENQNIEKLLSDCAFDETDLNGDGVNEKIVKINWFSDGRFGISEGFNYERGAQGQGDFYIYAIRNRKPACLGVIEGGMWKILASTSEGFHTIETWYHMSVDEYIINQYRYRNSKYELVSSVWWRLAPDGQPAEKLRVLEGDADTLH
jgi:hypothetical protein